MQGANVTLECKMTYYLRSRLGLRPRATITTSIEWEDGAGITRDYSDVFNTDGSITMQVKAVTKVLYTFLPRDAVHPRY